ncbi:MAG: Signal peptidase-like protein [Spirosomaceae bacterium]|nr:Signal peptidase-like protein [Spirosomataceae bacterium]
MGCGQCSTGGCGSVRSVAADGSSGEAPVSGCQSKGGCGSGGCTKINSFDWLGNMSLPSSMRYDVVEIKFKGGTKEYFRNSKQLDLYTGDFVVCEMPNGYHIGTVSLQGELVRLQLIKKKIKDDNSLAKIIRVANEDDLRKHELAINRDLSTMYRSRELVHEMKLKMKLSDVEFQSDNTKATFYYSADDRVDFRELIKVLAGEFKIRVEMKQISVRQEAARIGGLGSCGRELCCSTWLTDFKPIPATAARYQNLSLNPAKLSGQCGRLKCCLNYELETYIDALIDIPKIDRPLLTEKGPATLQKTDIFRRLMWFSYEKDSNWYPIPCSQVVEITEMNKRGEKPVSIVEMVTIDEVFTETTLNNDIAQLDKRLANKSSGGNSKSKRKRKPNRNRNRPQKGSGNKPNN